MASYICIIAPDLFLGACSSGEGGVGVVTAFSQHGEDVAVLSLCYLYMLNSQLCKRTLSGTSLNVTAFNLTYAVPRVGHMSKVPASTTVKRLTQTKSLHTRT